MVMILDKSNTLDYYENFDNWCLYKKWGVST